MEVTIKLLDGEHTLKTPSYYGLQLIDEYGAAVISDLGVVPALLAALLTDAEPIDPVTKSPVREWTSIEVAKLIPIEDDISKRFLDTIDDLIADAQPKAKEKSKAEPNAVPTTPAGEKKP